MEPIVAAHPGERIAVVVHGGVLDSIYRFADEAAASRGAQLAELQCQWVDYDGDPAHVVSWGDVSHLSTDTDDDNLRKRG